MSIIVSASPTYTYNNWGTYTITQYVTSGVEISSTSNDVVVNPTPEPTFSGTLSAGSSITFWDLSNGLYFDGTIVSASWNFGDGNVSAGSVSSTILHSFGSEGSYVVTLSAFDISGSVGAGTVNVPIFASIMTKTEVDYITICGPQNTYRYGASKKINLIDFLPNNLRGGETEDFLNLFQDFLNEMFDGLDGFSATSEDVSISGGYDSIPFSAGDNWPRNNTYTLSGNSNETDASNVEEIKIYNPDNYATEKISILEKVKRISELHDPELVDLEYIQFFARNLGYDIDISRGEVGISAIGSLGDATLSAEGCCLSADSDKYLRFVISNLPTWYKIKSTRNAIKIMLYSFGLVGDVIEYYTDNYLPSNNNGNWRLDYERELADIPGGWYPTPHFSISINIDNSADISSDIARRSKVINAIESIRPINTVFRNLSAYLLRETSMYVGSVVRLSRYIKIEADGWANNWSGSPPTWEANPL